MQTFLPYINYERSARVLDRMRLGKQRVETKQILKALREPNYGWKHHPAVKMWAGYEYGLVCYGIDMCVEWRRRGFSDTLLDEFHELRNTIAKELTSQGKGLPLLPHWLGDKLTTSHKSNLIRKDPAHYANLFPGVPDDIPYYWPTKDANYARPDSWASRRAA